MTIQKGICLVYTHKIPKIILAYDHLCHIPGVYRVKTLWVCLVPVTYPPGHGIYQAMGYTRNRPIKFLPCITQGYDINGHMTGVSWVYHWNIPGIYFFELSCTWYKPSIFQVYTFCIYPWYKPSICQKYFWYIPGHCISAYC